MRGTHTKFTVTASVLPGDDLAEFDAPMDVEFDSERDEAIRVAKESGRSLDAVGRFVRLLQSNESLRDWLVVYSEDYRRDPKLLRTSSEVTDVHLASYVSKLTSEKYVALMEIMSDELPKECWRSFKGAVAPLRDSHAEWKEVSADAIADLADNEYEWQKGRRDSLSEIPEIGGER